MRRHTNGGWEASWTDPATGKRRTETFRDSRRAAEVEAERRAGRLPFEPVERILVGELWDRCWRRRRCLAPSYRAEAERIWCRRIDPSLGHLKLWLLRPADIEAWLRDLALRGNDRTGRTWISSRAMGVPEDRRVGLAEKTGRNYLYVLSLALRWAVEEGLAEHNPAADLDVPAIWANPYGSNGARRNPRGRR